MLYALETVLPILFSEELDVIDSELKALRQESMLCLENHMRSMQNPVASAESLMLSIWRYAIQRSLFKTLCPPPRTQVCSAWLWLCIHK